MREQARAIVAGGLRPMRKQRPAFPGPCRPAQSAVSILRQLAARGLFWEGSQLKHGASWERRRGQTEA